MMSLTRICSRPADAEIGIGAGGQLFPLAEHRIHFRHGGIGFGLGLRRATGDDDPPCGIFALELADRLARLAHRFGVTAQVLTTSASRNCASPARALIASLS